MLKVNGIAKGLTFALLSTLSVGLAANPSHITPQQKKRQKS
nr:hypothetical protein [Alteromonas sp. KUL42]